MKKGVFIAFEGLDGSGKTTQFNAISDRLTKHGVKCKTEKEPSESNLIGLLLRGIIKKLHGLSVSPVSLAKLFSVDRYEHVLHDIKPYIKNGGHVLMDRYVFSSFAYQGLTSTFEDIYLYNRDAIKLLMPDITIFIDTPPEICLERINKNRVGNELFDYNGVEVRKNFFNAFEKMKDTVKVEIINGNQSTEVLTDAIWDIVWPWFE